MHSALDSILAVQDNSIGKFVSRSVGQSHSSNCFTLLEQQHVCLYIYIVGEGEKAVGILRIRTHMAGELHITAFPFDQLNAILVLISTDVLLEDL